MVAVTLSQDSTCNVVVLDEVDGIQRLDFKRGHVPVRRRTRWRVVLISLSMVSEDSTLNVVVFPVRRDGRMWSCFREIDEGSMVSEESTSNGRVSMMDKMKSMVSERLDRGNVSMRQRTR